MLRRLALAALAGGSLSLAFEPVAVPYVVPLCLAGYALATRGLRVRSGFLVGLVFGVAFYFPHIWWMSESIGWPAWVLLASVEAFFYGLLGGASPVLQRLRAWPAWLAFGWVAMECVRTTWPFSGMPWGRLGFAVVDTPVAPALAWLGTNGVSLLLAGLGFLLARVAVAERGAERLAAGTSLVGLAAVAVAPTFVPWTLPTTGQVDVAAVQGNVPGRGNDVLYDVEQLTRNHVDVTLDLAEQVDAGDAVRPDFVVWPENSTARDPFSDATIYADISRAVEAIGVPVMVGGIVDGGPDHVLNQGIVWDPRTGPGERYAKRHPVAFGEYIPFRDRLPESLVQSGQLARIPRDMLSGTRATPLDVGGVLVADAICFDVGYDDGFEEQVAGGAELLVVQTSNASFIFTDQVEQQFAITRARAIESGRWLVVASTNGIAGIIAPDGSVLDRTERLTQDLVQGTVDLKSGMTPGLRVGTSMGTVAPAITLVGLAWGIILGWRARRRARHDREDGGESVTPSPTAHRPEDVHA
ncbi:apolipoprotein N-acyltransferase [Nocardioides litoris]|uniref:apolipoprotein N-acyltransferase n=1 Tax=Nocardioides litoris TaxID=1926648 RepID=UPI0011210BE1|nr:apolipoprotein N-acyltransferase [Nocardioides litoris]